MVQSAMAEKILLLKRCLTISDTANPKTINSNALNPGGVAVTVSIKIPNTSPVIVEVSSEQNIHIITRNAMQSKGFACAIFILKIPLY